MKRTLLLVAATLASGCSTFYTRTTAGLDTRTTFDDRLHDGLLEVFNTCQEPIVIEPGQTELDLVNGCDLSDTPTAQGDLVLLMLSTSSPIALPSAIPSRIFRQTETVEINVWPIQNCEVHFTTTLDLNELELRNQETEWRTHDARPSLHIDYDFPSNAHVADLTVTADVDCPSGLNESALQASVDLILPNGGQAVELSGADLDIDVELSVVAGAVSGTLDVNFNVGAINVDTFIIDVANLLGVTESEILGAFDLTNADLNADVNDLLVDALADLPDVVEDALAAAVPPGQSVRSVSIVNTDDLRITSR